jgi:RND family efflux transporter MFP subunit
MITEVAVARTQSEFKRQEQLLSKNATPETKWEQAKAEYEGSMAARDKARAALDRAELDLEYTEVKANIAGEVSETFVKKGNLVADGTLLAAITKLDPIAAKFNVSERYVNQLQRQATAGERERRSDLQSIAADLQRDGDQGYPFRGNLTYIDTTGIDQSTGTLMIKAEFPNADKRILPGNSVRVRVPVGVLEDALLIPERAVAADQAGRYVFVVTADNKAERRNVQLGPNYGRLVVVEEGLQAGDKVIVDGLQRVRGGAQVTPSPLDLAEEADALDVAIHQDAETADNDVEANGEGGDDAPPAENEATTTERAATSADEPPPDASTQSQ